jgi:hypothetical protein
MTLCVDVRMVAMVLQWSGFQLFGAERASLFCSLARYDPCFATQHSGEISSRSVWLRSAAPLRKRKATNGERTAEEIQVWTKRIMKCVVHEVKMNEAAQHKHCTDRSLFRH